MSAYITLMCVVFLSFPGWFFNLHYSNYESISDSDYPDKKKHFTLVFNIFVHAQLFNQINCRKVDKNGYNIFENILDFYKSFYFWFILILELVVQYLIVQLNFLETFFITTKLESHEYLMNVIYGASVLVVGAVIRSLPEHVDEALKPMYVAEHEDLSKGNKIMQAYKEHLDGKVDKDILNQLGKKKQKSINVENEDDDKLFERAEEGNSDDEDSFRKL